MEDLVLSIDQCKHLLELGLDMSDAKLCWLREYAGRRFFVTPHSLLFEEDETCIRTYTLQEVLEKLPKSIKYEWTTYCLFIDFVEGVIYYQEFEDAMQNILHENGYVGINLLDASYNMLCWVIENGFLK